MVILEKRVKGLSRAALERFVTRACAATRLRGYINLLVTGSPEMRAMNRRFRGKNKATDVLSFPSVSPGAGRRKLAGEVAISADIAAQNAVRHGHSPAEEIRILTLHGMLHLAGFDHERDNGEMAREELQLRRSLRLPTGLIERTAAPPKRLKVRARSPRTQARETR